MREQHLVTTAWLAAHLHDAYLHDADLHDADLRIYDATVHLRPATPGPYTIESGHADYLAAHIPGAAFLDLAQDLSDHDSSLPFTMPKAAQLNDALYASAETLRIAVALLHPLLPESTVKIWEQLGMTGSLEIGRASCRERVYSSV